MADDDPRDPEAFRRDGHRVIDMLADHLAEARRGEMPVLPFVPPDEMAARWDASLSGGAPLDELLRRVLAESIHQHHPRCMGHQVAAPWPRAALFDMVASLLNNGMASYESGPVSSAMERHVARWLSAQLGFADGDGFLTSGGTLGNLTALLAARQACAGFDVWAEGTKNQQLAVIVSEHAHYCVDRAVRVMGWGKRGVVLAEVDDGYRLRADHVEAALRAAGDRRVIAVVATAGASSTGTFDPLPEIADLCRQRGLWLHVDGAHGASAALSDRYRHLVDGIEHADSVVWDAHKLMSMPALVTAVLFRDGQRSFGAFQQEAAYLFEGGDAPWHDYGRRNMECTKRMMSLGLYGTLATLGREAIGDAIARQFDLARRFAEMVQADGDFELAVAPQANIVCLRYRDADQDALRKKLIAAGRFFVTRTTLRGRAFLRVTLMNPATDERDLAALLEEIRRHAVS